MFSNYKFYYEEDNEDDYSDEETREFESCCRKKIYRYNNVEELDRIIFYAKINDIPIATFSQANGELRKEFEQFNKSSEEALLDLTSVSYALEDNKTLIYALEQFLAIMPNIRIIAQTVRIDVLLRYFPLFLEGQESIGKLFPDLSDIGVDEQEYDMDGYVIIFTSNLLSEAEYKKEIPPELQTRFDLVCEFEKPEMSEKIAFLELLLEKARNKYSEQFARIEMTEQEKTQLFDFDYASLSALRDIKRIFNNRLMDYFIEKGVM